jgi:DNA-binding transcriptional MerR regulator
MRTGEVAAQAGVNIQTLRYYERRGLLPEPPRRASGYRVYGLETVGIVRFIKRAQELGFSLEDVEALFALMTGGPDDCDQVRRLALGRIGELERRIADLRAVRDSLDRLVATCHRPRAERHCPLLRALGCEQSETDTHEGERHEGAGDHSGPPAGDRARSDEPGHAPHTAPGHL